MCAYVRGYLSRGQLMLHHGQVITICIKRPFYFERVQKIWKHLRFLATERFSFVLPCSLGVCLYIICLSASLLSICISWTALGRNGRGDKAPKYYDRTVLLRFQATQKEIIQQSDEKDFSFNRYRNNGLVYELQRIQYSKSSKINF